MVDWTDDGIVLAARPHGEGSAVVVLLTRDHGRHAGLVRGAFSGRARGLYQAGNRVTAEWRARLAEHPGNYACEIGRTTRVTPSTNGQCVCRLLRVKHQSILNKRTSDNHTLCDTTHQ